jgi:hypothetical protein
VAGGQHRARLTTLQRYEPDELNRELRQSRQVERSGLICCLTNWGATQSEKKRCEADMLFGIDPLLSLGVVLATAATDAVYVMFTSAVIARRRVPAATWSSVWYLLSSFAVISYTNNWVYVLFAAIGSWIGAYVTMTFLHGPPSNPPAPLKPSPMPGFSERS